MEPGAFFKVKKDPNAPEIPMIMFPLCELKRVRRIGFRNAHFVKKESRAGLEQHESESIIIVFIFGNSYTITLSVQNYCMFNDIGIYFKFYGGM